MNNATKLISITPEIAPFLADADHIDVKTVTGAVSMREFIAAMFAVQPGWVNILWGVRAAFVRVLGMRQTRIPRSAPVQPADVPMIAGQRAWIFTVWQAAEERYWIGGSDDHHLKAGVAVVVEPLGGEQRRFHIVTIVHYHHWTGPLYFNVIRPFHHLVVGNMIAAGMRNAIRAHQAVAKA